MEQFLDTFMHHWFWGSEEAIFLATFFAGIVVSAICYRLSVVFNDEWIYAAPIFFFFLCLTIVRIVVTYCLDFVEKEPVFAEGLSSTASGMLVSYLIMISLIVVYFKRLRLINNDPYWFL